MRDGRTKKRNESRTVPSMKHNEQVRSLSYLILTFTALRPGLKHAGHLLGGDAYSQLWNQTLLYFENLKKNGDRKTKINCTLRTGRLLRQCRSMN